MGQTFEITASRLNDKKFSLAYVDCDSYRATEFVSNFIFPKISKGGIIVFEDYGHHDLLGARYVIDKFIKLHREEIIAFFSFFSGLKIVIKK